MSIFQKLNPFKPKNHRKSYAQAKTYTGLMSRADISKNALEVLKKLSDNGYHACLVGGGVRDTLLGLKPKDFDIATNATPEKIHKIFNRQSRIIGRRFKLVHVYFHRDIIEVATYRGTHDDNRGKTDDSGRIITDNVYGTIEHDVVRRDFKINALYFDYQTEEVIDFVGGIEDLKSKSIHVIGNVDRRFAEDPVRMIRAIRFAVKLDLKLSPEIQTAIQQHTELLAAIPPARLWEEQSKLFLGGKGLPTFDALSSFGLMEFLFPLTIEAIEGSSEAKHFVQQAFARTDERVQQGRTINPGYLIAALLWPSMNEKAAELLAESDIPASTAYQKAERYVLNRQREVISIPKRFAEVVQEIWDLQRRFKHTQGRQSQRVLESRRFRAAYDFLQLRAECGDEDAHAEVENWREFHQNTISSDEARKNAKNHRHDKRRRRRRRSN